MPKQRVVRFCAHCGEPIRAYAATRKYCSHPCSVAARVEKGATIPKRCEHCDAEFMAVKHSRRFCSKNCSRKVMYAKSKRPAGECRGCGIQLGPEARSDKKFCSVRCRSAYYESCRQEQGQPSNYRKGWNGYALILIADPCSYCGGPADTVDHIVARSRGGEHSLNNLTAVCHQCNQKKRARSLLSFLMVRTAEQMFPGWIKSADNLP